MKRQERIANWARQINVVPVVWFETIRQFKGSHDGQRPPVKSLNKIGTLAAFRIDPSGLRLPVGYSWYRYGPVAEALPPEVQRMDDDESRRQLMDWVGPRPDVLPDDSLATRVREEVARVVAEFPREDDFERLVDETYEYAPFPFQRSFRIARMKLGLTGRGSRFEAEVKGREFWDLFSDALGEFPEEEFPQVALFLGPLRELVKLTWNRLPVRDPGATREIVEGFWDTFCAFLRVHPSAHSRNLNREVLENRATYATWGLDRLGDLLADTAIRLSDSEPDVVEDATLGPLIEKRKTDMAEQTAAITHALEAADEIKRIISQGD
jgi:hypothetical protein